MPLTFKVIFLLITTVPLGFLPITKLKFDNNKIIFTNLLAESDIIRKCLDPIDTQPYDRFEGRHAIMVHDNHLFVTSPDGVLEDVNLDTNQTITVARLGPKCRSQYDAAHCGLAMSVRMLKEDYLIVADAYKGIKGVNRTTGEVTILVSSGTFIDGKPSKYFYDVVYSSRDNALYLSVVSTEYDRDDAIVAAITENAGRIIKYDLASRDLSVALDDLDAPQGIELSPDEDFLLVSRIYRGDLLRLWLHGPLAGKVEIFTDGLVGVSSAPRKAPGGGYYVAHSIGAINPVQAKDMLAILAQKWFVRGVSRRTYLITHFGKLVQNYFPNPFTAKIAQESGTREHVLGNLMDGLGVVYEINEVGEITGGMMASTTKEIYMAAQHKNRLFLGVKHASVASIELTRCFTCVDQICNGASKKVSTSGGGIWI